MFRLRVTIIRPIYKQGTDTQNVHLNILWLQRKINTYKSGM